MTITANTTTNLMDIHRASVALTDAHPTEILDWAHAQVGGDLVVTASFGDAVLVHLAATHIPGVEVVLIDTGYLFAQTLWYAETLRSLFDLNLTIVRPETGPDDTDLWQRDTNACCAVRKVEPLNRALRGRAGWVTGLRRADGPSRAKAPTISYDLQRQLIKVNPLAAMTDADIDEYYRLHDLPRNPLTDQGYASIGCWPCTSPVEPGDDPRAGRWAGSDKTECGLHL